MSAKQAQAHLVRVVSGTNPACGSTHACQKSKHKHTLCTLYQAQAQPAVAHTRVGKASTSTPCAHCIRHKLSLRSHTCVSEKQAQAQLVRIVSGTKPACGSIHACQKRKHKHTLCTLYQAQAQPAVANMRVGEASTSTPCAHCIRHKPGLRSHTCVSEKQAQAQLVRVVSGTSPACGRKHACRKSKHKHTLCTLYQAQAQPAVAHMRVGKAGTSTCCAYCIRLKPSLQ